VERVVPVVMAAPKLISVNADGTNWRDNLEEVLEEGYAAKGRKVDVRFETKQSCRVMRVPDQRSRKYCLYSQSRTRSPSYSSTIHLL
jgi:hypothetical protein